MVILLSYSKTAEWQSAVNSLRDGVCNNTLEKYRCYFIPIIICIFVFPTSLTTLFAGPARFLTPAPLRPPLKAISDRIARLASFSAAFPSLLRTPNNPFELAAIELLAGLDVKTSASVAILCRFCWIYYRSMTPNQWNTGPSAKKNTTEDKKISNEPKTARNPRPFLGSNSTTLFSSETSGHL